MNKITVSAPGKLMLLGEHAVVYNHPCLVTAVDKRLYATVEMIDKPEFQLEAADVGITGYKKPMSEIGEGDVPKGAQFVEIAIKNTLRHSGLSRISRATAVGDSGVASPGARRYLASLPRMTVGIRVVTKSEFIPKLGFGRSSASTVSTVKAVSELFGLNLSQKEIFDLSYKTVLDVQGKGSGFDVAAAVYGGTLYFATGGKVIEPLNISSLPLVVGYSGIKKDTVILMDRVKKSFSNRKNRLEEIYNGIEALVNKGKESLIKMAWKRFGDLMNKNQEYLCELGVSMYKLDRMVKASIDAGTYGAKLSGAGGGDFMIALHSVQGKLSVQKAIKKAGGEIIDVGTNAEGVREE